MNGCPKAFSIEITMYQNLIHPCSSAVKVWGGPFCCQHFYRIYRCWRTVLQRLSTFSTHYVENDVQGM
jgi:hypothetical protein